MRTRSLLNDSLLLTTAAIWGFAFVAQRVGMDHIGPFTYNGIRFLLGASILVPVALWLSPLYRIRVLPTIGAGIVAGSALFIAASLQQIGLVYTTAGNAGFITGLYVVLVPIIGIGRRQKIGSARWLAVALAVVGLWFLSVSNDFRINPGDIFVIGSAFFFAAHVQLIDHLAPRYSALWLSLVQYVLVGILSLTVGGIFETFEPNALRNALPAILYGGIGSISIAYTLQVIAQRDAEPSHAAIILSLEGSFAALGGWLLLGEVLTPRGLLGCALLLAGMLLSQLSGILRGDAAAGVEATPVPGTVEPHVTGGYRASGDSR
ncbi:MAG: DMT family transporter [Alkalispirochaeta sp.]